MMYKCDLGSSRYVYIENEGTRTTVTLFSGGPGQQQSQASGFETGVWQMPPVLFQTATGLVIRIEAAGRQFFIQIQGGAMQLLRTAPSLAGADVVALQQVDTRDHSQPDPMEPMQPMEPMEPMKPMKPMEPLRMGNMEMRMNPMEMRMGSMRLRMDTTPEPAQTSPQAVPHRFCTQCGTAVSPHDRFCSSCGHRLTHVAE